MARTATSTTVTKQGRGGKVDATPFSRPNLAKGYLQLPKASTTTAEAPKGYRALGKTFNPMFHFKKEGDFIEGVYKAIRENVGEDDDRKGSNIYTLLVGQGANEQLIDVWGKAVLDRAMLEAKIDDRVRIVYDGTKPSKFGTDMHLFSVFVRE